MSFPATPTGYTQIVNRFGQPCNSDASAISMAWPASNNGVTYYPKFHRKLGGYPTEMVSNKGGKSTNLDNDVYGHIQNDHLSQYTKSGIWGYVCRYISGTTTWSTHAWGIAIDISASYEHQGSCTSTVNKNFAYFFKQHGWRWGLDFCDPIIGVSDRGADPRPPLTLSAGLRLYGALTLTSTGEMHMVAAVSGPTFYPSVFSTGQDALQGDFLPSTWVAVGGGPLDNYQKSFKGNRWGDYSGAATDPTDPNTVWLGSEFAATGTFPSNWGTVIAQGGAALGLDTRPPSIANITDAPDPFPCGSTP